MPLRELKRLQTIHRFLNLEIDKDSELQEIAVLAAELLDCPVALITMMHERIQYFLYKVGTDQQQNAIKYTFCQYLKTDQLLIVTDATLDPRFANNPHVKVSPFVRFYAGAALRTHDGHQLGSLCVMDMQPRQLSQAQEHLLKVLAKRIIQITEFEFSINLLKEQFIKSRESEIKLWSFFETSSALHLLVGKDLKVIDFNRNLAGFIQQMYQLKLEPGLPVSEVLQGPALVSFIKDFEIAATGEVVQFERQVTYPNGRKIWWYVTFEPGFNPEGEIVGISYNAMDINERKNNEALVLEQNEALREIAFIQSHEMRKPVASILGLMEVIKTQTPGLSEELAMMEPLTLDLDHRIRQIVEKIS